MNQQEENKSVYKFYKIDQNLYNSLINNEFYFSNPRFFNDPFDANPRFKICNDMNKLKSFYLYIQNEINNEIDTIKGITNFNRKHQKFKILIDTQIHLNQFDELYDYSKNIFEDRLIEIFTFYNDLDYFDSIVNISEIELQKKMFDDYIFLTIDVNEYGIWSGSKTSTCPVLWGHYADNHRGICIEYQLTDDDKNNVINFPEEEAFKTINVNYTNEPLDIFSLDDESLTKLTDIIINTKYIKWDYEKETRLINYKQGLNKFNKKSLKRIIFGYKTSPKERYALCKLLAHLNYKAGLYIAKVQPDAYELIIEEMKIHDIAESGVYLKEMNLNSIIPKL